MESQMPPGPRYPGALTLYLTQRHTQALLESANKRFGDVFTFRLIRGKTLVFASDPAMVEAIFTADSEVLIGDAGAEVLVGKTSVLVLNGEPHQAARSLLLPSFNHDHIERYKPAMERIVAEELASWPVQEPFPLLPRLEAITLGVVVHAIFGVAGGSGLGALGERFSDLIAFRDKPIGAMMINVMPRGSKPPKSFLKVRDAFDAAIYEQINTARRDPGLPERDDILGMLLRATHEDGSPMTDVEIRDELTTLLIQGHVSTATTLAWALERLVRHPDVLERLTAEAQTGDDGEYLDAVIKETLRLRPAVPVVVREVAKPFMLGQYQLGPGALVAANGFALHRREDLYPEPLRFRPERWLGQKPGTYTWIPFGGGVRHCIGRSLATYEMKYVLRTMMRQFRFAPSDQPDERSKRRGIGWIPKEGARVVIRERVPAVGAAPVPA